MTDNPAGEVLPDDAQAILRTNSECRRLLSTAVDVDRFTAEMTRVAARFNSLARLDSFESGLGVRSDG